MEHVVKAAMKILVEGGRYNIGNSDDVANYCTAHNASPELSECSWYAGDRWSVAPEYFVCSWGSVLQNVQPQAGPSGALGGIVVVYYAFNTFGRLATV